MSTERKDRRDGLVIVETRETTRLSRPRMYKVLLHNDDYTTMDFVVEILKSIFAKSDAEAATIMLKVHLENLAVAGVYTHEIAETKAAQVMEEAARREFPFLCSVEPVSEPETEA